MSEPLEMSFDVACSPEHAFSGVDVEDRHLVAARPHRDRAGRSRDRPGERRRGRIYERTPDGVEHDWGEVTIWEPPTRLAYLWHLRRDRADATEVEIRFVAQGPRATRVEIEHRGLGATGAAGEERRARNRGGWEALLPHFRGRNRERRRLMAAGTKEDPWVLKTPPGTSEYTMYKDEQADPPALVCQVGSTTLKYHLRAIEDLHAWLVEQGDWVVLGRGRREEAGRTGHRRGVGAVTRQPGRRLVRPAQRLPRPVRDVPPAAAGGARPGRGDPRTPQQLDAGDLTEPLVTGAADPDRIERNRTDGDDR